MITTRKRHSRTAERAARRKAKLKAKRRRQRTRAQAQRSNRGDGNFYATGSGSPLPAATASGSTPAGVVDSKDQTLLQLFPTYNVAAVTGTGGHPSGTSHSIAANARNNLVFVPLPANNAFLSPDAKHNCLTGCIAVFAHPDEDRTD